MQLRNGESVLNKVYVVGIGPGSYEQLTLKAIKVLEECDVIVGYQVYIDLVKDYFPGKEFLSTPMKQETTRCRLALEEARKGRKTAMICSGDAGVYGMAGLMFQVGLDVEECEVEVIPGITAANAGAAVLGAPLMHDFAVISLSDLLTPWEKIEKRILCAAEADFVICFYNPSSKKRCDYLKKACDLILTHADCSTICGVVSQIGRDGESAKIMTLAELRDRQVDMFTTVYIGNSQTKRFYNHMVTPRGYKEV